MSGCLTRLVARNDAHLGHCEAIAEAINGHRISMILALHTVDCHEANASRNDIMSATEVAPPILPLVIASKPIGQARQSTGIESPEKARAKLERSHSTAAL